MKFDLPKDSSSIIKVIGVGGGGSNAVNHMFRQGIKGVDFVVCNTDQQALDISPVPLKVQLGSSLTEGRGAGSLPEVGMNAAIENLDDIREILEKNTKMVFVTAGMGGGTGTGAAPVIAKLAKELGILTVGIVTVPFVFEGRKRRTQAEEGIDKMREAVDTLLIINNDKLREMFGNLTLANAFSQADDVLTTAAKGIAEVISVTGAINVDFNDVNTVMRDSGVAIMGSAAAEGENRAQQAVERALSSPLLNDNQIVGAKYVLLNITYGDQEVLMDEIADITDYIQDEAGSTADVIWGHGYDETLGDKLSVTLIATGFKTNVDTGLPQKEPERRRVNLEEERPTMITAPIQNPIASPVQNSIKNEEDNDSEDAYIVKREAPEVTDEETKEPTSEVESNWSPNATPESKAEETNDFSASTPENKVEDETEEPKEEQPVQKTMFTLDLTDNKDASTDEPAAENNTTEWNFQPPVNETNEEEQPVNKTWLDDESTPEKEVRSFNLESSAEQPAKSEDGKIRYMLDEEDEKEASKENDWTVSNKSENETQPSVEDNADLARMRQERIRQTGSKMKSAEGLNELEKEPAYLRRNIRLEDVPHSSETQRSRFTLGENKEGEDGKTGLSGNNSFLHDNVD
ncbi:cell division protein FtsZ [Parvicella tangerina]|uniref:Cell division protein FtsZ n=1 Tax=Parvicella tangerina TaxID=2829795 RepID=A0A916JR35_9FLAO|nr:cell division protein FtsZ [Parvicella tangerina]CAG5085677.1 Cell division protein FtsZ [Parvicella tangerina]